LKTLPILVDFDNLDSSFVRSGVLSLSRSLVSIIPTDVLEQYNSISVRLYGGWRCQGALTIGAQRLIPEIRANSPATVGNPRSPLMRPLRLSVELAETLIGTTAPLTETLVRDRDLRKFRFKNNASKCSGAGVGCGFNVYVNTSYSSQCPTMGCSARLGEFFVRDEQKMVDTLLVADIAAYVMHRNIRDLVVVSSDADMWPGVLLAMNSGCNVVQVHPRSNWRTQRHLLDTIRMTRSAKYFQTSF